MRKRIRTIASWARVLALDGAIVGLAWTGAFLIRFDGTVPEQYRHWLLFGLPVVILIRLSALFLCGVYWAALRFAGVLDLWRILKGMVFSSAVLSAGIFMLWVSGFPRSVLIVDGVLALLGIGGVRMLYRFRSERPWRNHVARSGVGRRLLIVGAGSAGETLLRGLLHPKQRRYVPVGFVDDDRPLFHKEIHGVRVLGRTEDIPRLVIEENIEEIAVAIPSASGEALCRIVDRCMEAGRKPKLVPDAASMIHADGQIIPLREIEVEDLLQREPVALKTKDIRACLKDKTVLVTGAAGSIGSELCRQVMTYDPRQLILFDQSETGLYFLNLELGRDGSQNQVVPVVGDMTVRDRVQRVMERYRPQVVFHAAAYKHVPLMEGNPEEAIRNNLGGTMTLADESIRYGVERFVMISSDKAVQPTSIMGVSKRLCELFVLGLSRHDSTHFMTTRFGNVLDSSGSVVPVLQRQIVQGGPVTVTHPQIARYFMTISEAAQLVLQTASLGEGGELFVLNMGREMRILDLAERLIRLSGMEPYEDIPITFIGLRPGEKMYERLWVEGEVPVPTSHEKIFIARANGMPSRKVHSTMKKILAAAERSDRRAMLSGIQAVVPEYQPDLRASLTADAPFRRRPIVLLADNDPDVANTLLEQLGPGYEVIAADRGDTALQKVFARLPDVVVVDAAIPGMKGSDVCRRIKQHPLTRRTPVILLCEDGLPTRVAGSSVTPDVCLTKPLSEAELKAALDSLLDHRSSQQPAEAGSLRSPPAASRRETILADRSASSAL